MSTLSVQQLSQVRQLNLLDDVRSGNCTAVTRLHFHLQVKTRAIYRYLQLYIGVHMCTYVHICIHMYTYVSLHLGRVGQTVFHTLAHTFCNFSYSGLLASTLPSVEVARFPRQRFIGRDISTVEKR